MINNIDITVEHLDDNPSLPLNLLTSDGPESWGAAGGSGRAVGTRRESVGVAHVVLLLYCNVVAEICKIKIR